MKLADATAATLWKFVTSQKCYYFARAAIFHPGCDGSAKVVVHKFLASYLQKPMPPLA